MQRVITSCTQFNDKRFIPLKTLSLSDNYDVKNVSARGETVLEHFMNFTGRLSFETLCFFFSSRSSFLSRFFLVADFCFSLIFRNGFVSG